MNQNFFITKLQTTLRIRYYLVVFTLVLFQISANLISQPPHPFSGGSGTSASPFLISTLSDLNELADTVNIYHYHLTGRYFLLTADIVDTFRQTIGNDKDYFEGIFHGGGHKITLGITSDNLYVGLFSVLDTNMISSISVDSLTVDGYVIGGPNSVSVGGICGEIRGG